MTQGQQYIELSDLQWMIRDRIGNLESWVRVEIESHRVVGGHHYLSVLEKSPDGGIEARAAARIWRSNSSVISEFTRQTGQSLDPGISVVVLVSVDYHPQYGLALTILDIDAAYSIGRRELERKETIRKLTEAGLMDRQRGLRLPFLPRRIAVISSRDAAGYGDFIRHTSDNRRGFAFDLTLFQSLMQGSGAPTSIISAIEAVQASGEFDLVLILRGGGADADLYCYDDFSLCKAIAQCPLPVLTAVGHERDFHIADMVAHEHFKTPTALADALTDWVEEVEIGMEDAAQAVRRALTDRISELERAVDSSIATVKFALSSMLTILDGNLALIKSGIDAADPRSILRQGYVLASDREGRLLRSASAAAPGDGFTLRFSDGRWQCSINDVKIN